MTQDQCQGLLDRGLTAKESIMIHLKDFYQYEKDIECPHDMTQRGISEATGLTLSHIPRNLKQLKAEGMVDEGKAYISGRSRRYKTYFPTNKGLKYTRKLITELGKFVVQSDGEEIPLMRIILQDRERSCLDIIRSFLGEGQMDKITRPRGPMLLGNFPEVRNFVNRVEELKELNTIFEDDDTRMIVIYGSLGYGTSSLASKFAMDIKKKCSIMWVRVEGPLEHILEHILEHLKNSDMLNEISGNIEDIRDPQDLVKLLADKNYIIIFDGYFEVEEPVVEYFAGIVEHIKEVEGVRMIVTARENTASYNRFYTILDIHDSSVKEMHLGKMDIEACRVLLNVADITDDALRRLYLFTKGSPSIMKTLASDDISYIERNTNYSIEEIKLMLHLKTLRKEG